MINDVWLLYLQFVQDCKKVCIVTTAQTDGAIEIEKASPKIL